MSAEAPAARHRCARARGCHRHGPGGGGIGVGGLVLPPSRKVTASAPAWNEGADALFGGCSVGRGEGEGTQGGGISVGGGSGALEGGTAAAAAERSIGRAAAGGK